MFNNFCIYDLHFLDKGEIFIIKNYIKRNLKITEVHDVNNKKNIPHYSLEVFLSKIKEKINVHKSSKQKIHVIFSKILKHYDVKHKAPKQNTSGWKVHHELKQEIKRLKINDPQNDLGVVKNMKSILGNYLALKETKSKSLPEFYLKNKEIIDNLIKFGFRH